MLDVFGPDFRGVVGGSPEASLLAHACWFGNADVVRELLDRGARRDDGLSAVAAHGSSAIEGDHVGVVEALGEPPDPALLDLADGPLLSWLAERVA